MLRRLFISLLALVGTTLGGAVAGPGTAQAQGGDVDLAVSIEVPATTTTEAEAGPTITLTNSGSDTAYAVEVVVEADNISLDPTSNSPPGKITVPPIGSVALRDSKLIWSIARLPGRGRYQYTVSTEKTLGIKVVQYVATVSSRSVLEPEHDNRAEVWQIRNKTDNELNLAVPAYAVTVAVDDRFPAEQGDVTFTVVASHSSNEDVNAGRAHLRDAQVALDLPAGLIFSTPTPPTGTTYNSSTGIWTIGNWHPTTAPASQTHSLTLTATRAANTVLNELCMTAEISAKPPEPLARTADNRSEVCLGDEPRIVFGDGKADIFTLYDCVGQTQYPCGSSDSLEIVVSGYSTTTIATLDLTETALIERIQDIVGRWRQPESVVIHVKDPRARIAPVTGTGSVWSTGKVNHQGKATEPFGSVSSIFAFPASGFSNYRFGMNKTAGDGYVRVYSASNNSLLLDSETQTSAGPIASLPATVIAFVEFSKLGTYTFDLTMSAQHANGDCDTNGDNTNESFCDTETYTFHVGPISELAVRDGGPNPTVSSSQRAFTIRALNNGPDAAPAAQVKVDLQGATVSQAIASQGSYNNGVWTIGEFPGGAPTLTLITDAPADTPITATITNTQDYEVCIDSSGNDLSHTTQATCEADTTNGASWHTAKYYDYKSDNNTATVTAQAGTAGPQAAITVEWTAPADVTVSRYQVWRQGSPWKLIAEVPTGQTSYTDTTAEPGRAYLYTVRALDAQGIPVSSETLVAAPQAGSGQGGGGGSGGSTRPPPTDHHGNSPATATPLAPTARASGFLHAGDQDYFRLVLPHAGLLYVETTGWSNTVGSVWQGGVELGSAELGGRLYNFKLGVPVQPGPVVIRVTERSPTAFGTYRLYTRFIAGSVDQPPPLTVQNGLGMVTGWLCSADPVVLEIDGLPYHPAPMPAPVPPPLPRVIGTRRLRAAAPGGRSP